MLFSRKGRPTPRGASLIAILLLWALGCSPAGAVTLDERIALPGTSGRLDHMAVDLSGNRLFIAALGADTVDVVDLRGSSRASRLRVAGEPQGVAFVHGRLFVANGEGGKLQVFEGERTVGTLDKLPDADNVRLSTDKRLLFVGYGSDMVALDTGTLAVAWHAALPGHPEAFEPSPDGARLYVNVPAAHAVEVLDARNGARLATWSVAPMAGNFPMALDPSGMRLFVATRHPASLLVMDLRDGRQLQRLDLCSDADDLFFDARRQRLYAVCGEGELRVLSTRKADGYAVLQRTPTAAGARTGLLVPELDRLFVAAPQRARPAEILVFRLD